MSRTLSVRALRLYRLRHPIVWLVVTRSAAALGLVLMVSFLTFVIMNTLPGNIAAAGLGKDASPARIAQVSEQLHLNEPLLTRYVHWLWAFVRGDMGHSVSSGVPVSSSVLSRLRNTAILAGISATVAVLAGVLLGTYAGTRQGRAGDRVANVCALVLVATPEFVAGNLLAYFFGVRFHLAPAVALFDPEAGPLSKPSTLILPVATLSLVGFGYTMRFVRVSVAEQMRGDVVRMARLNGVPERRIVMRYALRNALGPTIQTITLTFTWLLAGAAVAETIYDYPGIGALMVEASLSRDIATMLAIATIAAAIFGVLMIVNDVLILLVNPRAQARSWS